MGEQAARVHTKVRLVLGPKARVATGILLGASVAAGCSSTPSASPTTTAASSNPSAPCTKAAISAAATNATSVGPVTSVSNFGCSGDWAYANVVVGPSSSSFDAVIVLQANGSSWSVADRPNVCSNHLVPTAIYTRACTTS